MIPADLLELLRCPETGQTLAVADDGLVTRMNAGALLADPVSAALVRTDGKMAYPIHDGIPVLLTAAAIPLLLRR